jgi:hypothetical protein
MNIKEFMKVFKEEFGSEINRIELLYPENVIGLSDEIMRRFELSGMRAVVKFYQEKNLPTAPKWGIPDDEFNDPK